MTHPTLSFPSLFAKGTSIGVAIEVPLEYRESLRAMRLRAEGEAAAEIIPPHITLVPPTQLPTWNLTPVLHHLDRVARSVAPFQVVLQGAGTFRPVTEVVFAALVEGEPECIELQRRAQAGPLDAELAFPYHPHVTVAQNVEPDALDRAADELAGFRAQFRVGTFVLYELGPDEVWHTIRTFTLGG